MQQVEKQNEVAKKTITTELLVYLGGKKCNHTQNK